MFRAIYAISRLRSAFLESRNCVPISRLCKQSWDCAIRLRNLEIAQTYCTIFKLLTLAMWLTASALVGRKPFIQVVSCSRCDIMRSTTVSDVVYRSAAGGFWEILFRAIRGEWLPNQQDHSTWEGPEDYPQTTEQPHSRYLRFLIQVFGETAGV